MPVRREESDDELRRFFRSHGFADPHPNLRFDRRIPLPQKAVGGASTLRWAASGVALAVALVLLMLAFHLHPAAPVKPVGRPQSKTPLPNGFQTVGSLLKTLGPVVQRGTNLTVLLPRSIPHDNPQTGHTWNAIYHASGQAYDLAIYAGPPLPVNSPKVGYGGNASFLMMVRGATTEAGLHTEQFGPLTAEQPNAAQGSVSLGNGIVATNFTAGAGTSSRTSVSWKEDGWTFVLTPTPASMSPDRLAAGIAKNALGLHLPGPSGTAVFTFGSDTPSLAVFRLHGTWYSVWANGWKAATYASTMVPVQ